MFFAYSGAEIVADIFLQQQRHGDNYLGWPFQSNESFKGFSITLYSLGNPKTACQRFVDTIVLIAAPGWSSFENVVETQFGSLFKRRYVLPNCIND